MAYRGLWESISLRLFPVFFCAARKTLPGVVGLLTCSFSRAWVLPLHRAQEEHQPVAKSSWDFPGRAIREESAYQYRRSKRRRFNPWVRKIPWRRKWQPTPVFLPGKSHGQRSLADYSPWGRKELDTTERLHFFFTSSGVCGGDQMARALNPERRVFSLLRGLRFPVRSHCLCRGPFLPSACPAQHCL